MSTVSVRLIVCIGIVFGSCGKGSEGVPAPIRISDYPDNKKAALSFTFDDNTPSCLTIIAPLFKENGLRATFFIIPDRISSNEEWKQWRALSEDGFEIGNHTMDHPDLRNIKSLSDLDMEINSAYAAIENNIGKAPFSFAHPFHATNDTVDQIVFEKHFASRLRPAGFCQWWGAVSESTEKMFDKDMGKAVKDNGWFVVSAHGINDGWSPMPQSLLEHSVKYAKESEAVICTETFGNLAKYKVEKQHTRVVVREQHGSLTISLVSDLDPAIFDYPLTLVVEQAGYTDGNVNALTGGSVIRVDRESNRLLIKVMINARIEITQ